MRYDRSYTSNEVARALREFLTDKPLAERLDAARNHLFHFAAKENCQDLKSEAIYSLNQLLEEKNFKKLMRDDVFTATNLFVDFICFAKADLAIAEYKEEMTRVK